MTSPQSNRPRTDHGITGHGITGPGISWTVLGLLAISVASMTIACVTSGEDASPEPEGLEAEIDAINRASRKIQDAVGPAQRNGNLLGEALMMRSLEDELSHGSESVQSMYSQMAATTESFLGNHAAALELWDQPDSNDGGAAPDPTPLEGLQREDAVRALARAARSSRAVFINEAHHVAQTRVLTRSLLPLLRQQGFTHFAAETLEIDTGLRERGYPTAQTGYYTQEPLYADLVRLALALGYEVVAYEYAGPPARREPGQARNLVKRVFQDPEARVLVHLGYSHNQENQEAFGGVGSMAYHFRELTGIDPLTIDQTWMHEHSRRSLEHPLFRYVADDLGITEPVVFVGAEGGLWHAPEDSRDVTVFLPRTRYENGRPDWLRLGGERQPLALPADVCGAAEACLVEARPADEGDDAIPVDRVEVSPSRDQPVLMVPQGPLRIQVLDADKQVLRTWDHPSP